MDIGGELLGKKLSLLQSVLAETEKQREFIAKRDVDGLCDSLAARQAMMDAIDGLDRQIAALPAGVGEAQAQEIRAVLERIIGLDDENRRGITGMTEGVASGFREVSAQRSVMAYTQAASSGSKFVDKEG